MSDRLTRAFGPRDRGVWRLLIVMLVVLAVCCCAGLLVSVAQNGTEPDDAPPTTKAAGTLTVPNLVGSRLPDAEDKLDALGFDDPTLEDATGRDRAVLSRQNWVVRGQDPAGGARVAPSTKVTLRVGKPTDTAATDAPADGVVPNVVCRDLQAAQDALQTAGYFVLASVDGTGQGRRQLIDRNWVVVKQSVAAGTQPARSTRVLLTVVKIGEGSGTCPT